MATTGNTGGGRRLRLTGTFSLSIGDEEVSGAGFGSRKARTLLALLGVERRHVVSVDRIIEVLWGDSAPTLAVENVATLVSRLRARFGADVVEGGRDGYRLGRVVRVDLDDATRWLDEADRRALAGEPGLAVTAATRAREIVESGGVLGGEAPAEWASPAFDEHAALLRRMRQVLAESAFAVGDHALARQVAAAALGADPYDERSVRVSMRADCAVGEPGRALATFASLRDLLADELGADPAAETVALNLAILRAEPLDSKGKLSTQTQPADSFGLAGRADELGRLRKTWSGVAEGRPAFVLVAGEAGIGKSRLADELAGIATASGGFLLAARCYETERSLFLQPVVEAVAAAARTLSPSAFRDLAGDNALALADLVPDAAAVLGPVPARRRGSAEMERRRAFEAATGFVVSLAARTPVLLALDDLQNAGRSTIEFLHYLRRRLVRDRLLILGTVRAEEGADVLDSLSTVAERIDLGPLPEAAVAELAGNAGLGEHAGDILRRTGGHALYVLETLRALSSGIAGLPPSLEAAVSARVRRAGRPVEDLLRAAAVLGSAFDPRELAAMVGSPVHVVAGLCTDALQARLLAVAGRDYEFAHDLVREVLYATTPAPTRNAYHLRAADLLTDRPEALAAHASAADDWPRAARGWLLAGEQALARAAAADAVELLGRCLAAVERDGPQATAMSALGDVRARALLTRGRAQAAQADYAAALTDIEQAVQIARAIGDNRLEMLALRELGGEIPTALGGSVADCIGHLERGLVLATSLSDRTMQADTQGWLAILAANGLRFSESVRYGESAVRAARASGDSEALAAALDGRKTSLAYIGEVDQLQDVIDELDPLLRRLGDLFRLHWAVFESSFGAIARGDWTTASDRIKAALEVQRQSGYTAYAGWHVAHLGWLARLQGRVDDALEFGRRALELCEEAPHVWCTAAAGGLLGATLLEIGERQAAIGVLERARAAAEQEGAEAYVLRCAAPLAEATGSLDVLLEADALIGGITAPERSAFLAGDWCYLAVARAWLAQGEPERARAVLAPLLVAAQRCGWVAALAGASAVDGRAAAMLGLDDEASGQFARARELAQRHGLLGIEREATTSGRQRSSAILPAARRAPSRSTGR